MRRSIAYVYFGKAFVSACMILYYTAVHFGWIR